MKVATVALMYDSIMGYEFRGAKGNILQAFTLCQVHVKQFAEEKPAC